MFCLTTLCLFSLYYSKKPTEIFATQTSLTCDIFVLKLLGDLKMILFHMQHLLISNEKFLSCIHFLANNLSVSCLYAGYNHRQTQIVILSKIKSDPILVAEL